MKRGRPIVTRISGFAVAGLVAVSGAAAAAPAPQHIRGTFQSVSGDTVTVQSNSAQPVLVVLENKIKYVLVVPSSLASLKNGEFIGTSTKGPKDFKVALEVHIFPASLRGTGGTSCRPTRGRAAPRSAALRPTAP